MLLIGFTRVGDGDIALTNAWKHMMEDAKLHHWNAVPLFLDQQEKVLDMMAIAHFPSNIKTVFTTHVQIQKTMLA